MSEKIDMNEKNNKSKKSNKINSRLLLLVILFLIVIAIIVIIFLVQRYYATTKECTICNGTGEVTGVCEGGQECWLCLGEGTRVLCNEVGRSHEHEYKSKELKECSNCDGYKWTTVYECSYCGYLTYYCNTCGELSGTGYVGSMAICNLCNNSGYVACEHNIDSEHSAQLECGTCNGSGRVAIDMETCNHHDVVIDEAQAATCTAEGKTEGSHCSICNSIIDEQEVIPATGHTLEETEDLEDGTHSGICTVCGEAIIENHTEEIEEAEEGMTAGSHCKVCNAIIKEPEAIQEHTEHTVEKWTDSGNGEHTGTCTECGETITENHSEVTDEAEDATCITAGKTEGSHCSVCNAVIKAQETIPVTGHTFENGICTNCGKECDHTDSVVESDTAKHWKNCNTCGLAVEEEEHSYTNGKCECGKEQEIEECAHESTEWKYESYSHWQECTECNEKISGTTAAHIYSDGKCIACDSTDPSTSDNLIPNTGIRQIVILMFSLFGFAVVGAIRIRKYKDI